MNEMLTAEKAVMRIEMLFESLNNGKITKTDFKKYTLAELMLGNRFINGD